MADKTYILMANVRGIELHDQHIIWVDHEVDLIGALKKARETVKTKHGGFPTFVMVPLKYLRSQVTPIWWDLKTYDKGEGRAVYYVLHEWPPQPIEEAPIVHVG
jgi:hypothetical protein